MKDTDRQFQVGGALQLHSDSDNKERKRAAAEPLRAHDEEAQRPIIKKRRKKSHAPSR